MAHDDDLSTVIQSAEHFDPTPLASYEVALVVESGPDAGKTIRIAPSDPMPVLIGQSVACAMQLSDPTVSRRHLSIEVMPTGIVATDLDSTNGTYVAGRRIMRAAITAGDLVQIGGSALRVEVTSVREGVELPSQTSFGRYLGASTELRRLYPLFERLAKADVPLVIEGETGTGKEVLAEAIHEASPRRDGPFVIFDCTTVPASLMEAELFGHEKGAFTGAQSSRKGVVEQAAGGTLFIDEIGDLDPMLQPKLLRALDRHEVRRIGGDRSIQVDVRVIAATRRDLDREVVAGRFRDDLFHRLAIARVALPPLRERRGDVSLLARRFAMDLGGTPDAIPANILEKWEAYSWPGNVRELRNAVARFVAIGAWQPSELGPAGGAERVQADQADLVDAILALNLPISEARRRVNEDFERRYIEHALAQHGGNVSRAAIASGVARRHFQHLKAKARLGDPED